MPEHVHLHNAEILDIEEQLQTIMMNDQWLTFFARDLGYDDHSAIHEAVKPILAKHVSRLMVRYHGQIATLIERKLKER